MSLSRPSYVSPTTGSDQATRGPACSTETATSASRTTPTLCVLVIATGPVSIPDSRTHSRPVSSPLPLRRWQPAKTGSCVAVRVRRHDDGHAGPDRTLADDERSVALDDRGVPDPHAGHVGDGVEGSRAAAPDGDAEVTRPHRSMLAARRRVAGSASALGGPVAATDRDPSATRRIIGRQMIPTDRSSAPLRLRRLPDRIAAARAIDAAEAFRDLPGLVLLESARPGRNARWTYLTADPVAILETPAAGPDPFAVARRLVARLDRTVVVPADAPPFLGGLVGFLGYDLGGDARAAAGHRAVGPGPPAAPARAPRLGRRVGPADRSRLARRSGPRRRRSAAGAPARRRPRSPDDAATTSRRPGADRRRSTSAPGSTAPPTKPACAGSATTSPPATSTRRT